MQKTSRTWLRDKRLEEGGEPIAGGQGCEQGKGEMTKRGPGTRPEGTVWEAGMQTQGEQTHEPQQPETPPHLPNLLPLQRGPSMGPHLTPVHTNSSGC